MYKKEKREDTGEVSRRLNMHAKKKMNGGKDIETNGKRAVRETLEEAGVPHEKARCIRGPRQHGQVGSVETMEMLST